MGKNFKEINCLEFNNKDNFFRNILEILEKIIDKFLLTKCSTINCSENIYMSENFPCIFRNNYNYINLKSE